MGPNAPRWILHLDMDAFFAAIEQRDDPALRGRPVVVGARPGGRGVVATCSYEARAFGIRSAMPINEAYRRCPQAVYLRPRIEHYRAVARQIRAVMGSCSPVVEPVSIDEAFLDLTGMERLAHTHIGHEGLRPILSGFFEAPPAPGRTLAPRALPEARQPHWESDPSARRTAVEPAEDVWLAGGAVRVVVAAEDVLAASGRGARLAGGGGGAGPGVIPAKDVGTGGRRVAVTAPDILASEDVGPAAAASEVAGVCCEGQRQEKRKDEGFAHDRDIPAKCKPAQAGLGRQPKTDARGTPFRWVTLR